MKEIGLWKNTYLKIFGFNKIKSMKRTTTDWFELCRGFFSILLNIGVCKTHKVYLNKVVPTNSNWPCSNDFHYFRKTFLRYLYDNGVIFFCVHPSRNHPVFQSLYIIPSGTNQTKIENAQITPLHLTVLLNPVLSCVLSTAMHTTLCCTGSGGLWCF